MLRRFQRPQRGLMNGEPVTVTGEIVCENAEFDPACYVIENARHSVDYVPTEDVELVLQQSLRINKKGYFSVVTRTERGETESRIHIADAARQFGSDRIATLQRTLRLSLCDSVVMPLVQ